MVWNDPVTHKLQDQDEQPGGEAKHSDLHPQGLHFGSEVLVVLMTCDVLLITKTKSSLFVTNVHHKVKLPDVGIILIASTTQLFPLSNIESPAPGWTNQLISDILSLDGLGLQLTIIFRFPLNLS